MNEVGLSDITTVTFFLHFSSCCFLSNVDTPVLSYTAESLLCSFIMPVFLAVRSLGSSAQTQPDPHVITASQTEGEETAGRNMGT